MGAIGWHLDALGCHLGVLGCHWASLGSISETTKLIICPNPVSGGEGYEDCAPICPKLLGPVPLGHPLGTLGHPTGTLLGTLEHPWCYFGRRLGTLGIPCAPLWPPLASPWRPLPPSWDGVSQKDKKTLLLITFVDSFRLGCTCNPTAPVQSKHTFGSYF